jgi:hypothetical protein
MKPALLFLFILSSLGAGAQTVNDKEPKRNPEWDSNTYYVERVTFVLGILPCSVRIL